MEVIIVGGGLAGLAAAQRLIEAGTTCHLVEGRDRLGGRVRTERVAGFPHPIELGPEWIGQEGVVARLLQSVGARTIAAQGKRYQRTESGLNELDDLAARSENLIDLMQKLPGGDRPLLEALNLCCAGPEYRDRREQLLAYVEGFHAADPARVSVDWLAKVEENQPAEASEHHALDGVDQLVRALTPRPGDLLSIYLNTVVHDVEWVPGKVTVHAIRHGDPVTLEGSRAIVALPLPALSQGLVRFSPALDSKAAALEMMEMGQALKVVLRMDRPFWEQLDGLGDALFLHALDQPFPTWWTMRPLKTPLMTGWSAGPQLNRVGGAGGEALLSLALTSLARVLAVPETEVAGHLQGWTYHDWGRDPFAAGAYSFVLAGGVHAHRILSQPLDHTLYFAGEATCGDGFNATMEGAVLSGWRAAQEVLDRP
jgi:monoamine oxidase